MTMKGIILAGGNATRLYPVTEVISKHLLPVYNKPMIFYPLSTLMQAGIKEILIISTPHDLPLYKELLGSGEALGINLSFIEQEKPNGLAEAFIIGEKFIDSDNCALILGDNLFFGSSFQETIKNASKQDEGASIFAYRVDRPESYGVVEFDEEFNALSIEEKPKHPKSNYAVTGLYFYDNDVVDISKTIRPSRRGELEITDINKAYLSSKKIKVHILGSGTAWLDTGTHDSLIEASTFVRTIENRQGIPIGCPEAIAYDNGWIGANDIERVIERYSLDHSYRKFLLRLLES
jgi:glucose-1-phosphate thymidylyltransferase